MWERRKALAGLRFELGGEDRTGADARLTQALIEAELRVGLLSRAAFHGQADITSLLEVRLLTKLTLLLRSPLPYCLCSWTAVRWSRLLRDPAKGH